LGYSEYSGYSGYKEYKMHSGIIGIRIIMSVTEVGGAWDFDAPWVLLTRPASSRS
jgi:hypothetical protein